MKRVAILALVLGAVVFVACGPPHAQAPESDPQITLQEARQYQNRVLLDLGGRVPAEQVIGGFDGPIERMSAMKCDWVKGLEFSREDSGVFLPGGYDIEVLPDTRLGEVFDQILAEYDDQGWAVHSEGQGADREMELVSPDEYTIFLSIYDSDPAKLTLAMSSFSPCIRAPEDFDIFEEY